MAHPVQQRDYSSELDHSQNGHEKHAVPSGDSKSSTPGGYPDVDDTNQGEVFDPYGGKKLGMIRVRLTDPIYQSSTHWFGVDNLDILHESSRYRNSQLTVHVTYHWIDSRNHYK